MELCWSAWPFQVKPLLTSWEGRWNALENVDLKGSGKAWEQAWSSIKSSSNNSDVASRVSLRLNESTWSLKTLSVCGLHEKASEEVIDDAMMWNEIELWAMVANVAETASWMPADWSSLQLGLTVTLHWSHPVPAYLSSSLYYFSLHQSLLHTSWPSPPFLFKLMYTLSQWLLHN